MRPEHRVALIGHRGARGLFPENTLEGFAAALGLGLDGVELDVALTADGVPVLSHEPALDPELTRTEDGTWLAAPGPSIRDLRADALARFDVGRLRPGSLAAARFPDQAPRDGARIPRLEDALKSLAGVDVLIELKTYPDRPALTAGPETVATAALAVVERCGLLVPDQNRNASEALPPPPSRKGRGSRASKVPLPLREGLGEGSKQPTQPDEWSNRVDDITFESFDWRGLRALRRLRPALPLAWLTSADTLADARLWWDGPHPSDFAGSVPRAVAAEAGSGGGAWAAEWSDLTEAQIAEAHELRLSVIAWTVNDAAAIARLIGWQVDAIITDRPDIARGVMSGLGLSLPAPLYVTPRPAP